MSKELPKDHDVSAHKDIVGQVMHRWKHHDPKPLHSGRGKGGKEGKVVKSQDQAIAISLSIAEKAKGSKKGGGKTMDHSERLQALGFSEDVSEKVAEMLDETFDFTRCVRPDGSSYGTGGKCRKGVEAKGPPLDEQIRDAYDREQAARRAGDHEGARAAMREHIGLVNKRNAELEAKPKKKKEEKLEDEKSLSRAWQDASKKAQDAERSGNPESIRKAKLEETRMWDKLTAFRREQERAQKEAKKKEEEKTQAAEQRRGPRTLTQLQSVSLRLKRSIEKATEEYNKLRPFLSDPEAKEKADAIFERIRKSVNLRGELERRIEVLKGGSELGPKPRNTSPLGDMRRAAAAMGARD